LRDFKLGQQKRVTWRNAAGEEVDGILIFPPDYVQGHRYPLIVDVYPTPARDRLYLLSPASGRMGQLEAASGYIVFLPGLRSPYTPGAFSRDIGYTEKARGSKGIAVMLDDYQSGIRFLVRAGLVDQDQVGVFGHSNGGGVANSLITEIKPGKCVVLSSAAWGDAFFDDLMLFQWSPGHTHMSEYVNGDMYHNIQDYIKMSPILRLNRVTVPILMLGGDKDWFSMLLMTMEFNALQHLGKEVTLVRYADEGHNLTKLENQKDWLDRVHRFFDEHLKQ
jgi:dipeptidyl aminopeptidase/acylaminoacyl peptidase